MRAISRLASLRRDEFSSAPVTDWNRRLNSSCRPSASRCSRSSSDSSLSSRALVKELSLSLHDFRLHRQLLACEPQRLLREGLRDAGELEHHAPGLDHRDPALGRALAGAHAGLGGLLRVALVREDVDPDFAAALDLAGHRDTGRLDLAVRDPAAVDRLQAVVAELHGRLALRLAAPTSAMDLAKLRLLRHQHQLSLFSCDGSPDWSSFDLSSCIAFCGPSGASATGFGVVSTSGWITGCSRPSADTALSSVRGFSTFSRCGGRPPPPRGRFEPAGREPWLGPLD